MIVVVVVVVVVVIVVAAISPGGALRLLARLFLEKLASVAPFGAEVIHALFLGVEPVVNLSKRRLTSLEI